jgi:hypothetical protein
MYFSWWIHSKIGKLKKLNKKIMWHIIYPGGKQSKIRVVEITSDSEYQLEDYSVASRKEFYDKFVAEEYAIELAKENNKFFIGPGFDGNYYLD